MSDATHALMANVRADIQADAQELDRCRRMADSAEKMIERLVSAAVTLPTNVATEIHEEFGRVVAITWTEDGVIDDAAITIYGDNDHCGVTLYAPNKAGHFITGGMAPIDDIDRIRELLGPVAEVKP